MTPDGLHALRREVEHLETAARREMAARIKAARELGDLKENAEYHDAKHDQAMLETKIRRLRRQLNAAVAVEPQEGDIVGFGSTVRVLDETSGREATYTFVGSAEARPGEGRLSADSPIGQALAGRRAGDRVSVSTPGGERAMRIVAVGA
ncbi:MAG: transcription elongation factor GreA [Solirubrobacteraceae bacterium]|nr:MAG: transcription elongation factor GreA [Solirubrobacterales bacterium]